MWNKNKVKIMYNGVSTDIDKIPAGYLLDFLWNRSHRYPKAVKLSIAAREKNLIDKVKNELATY